MKKIYKTIVLLGTIATLGTSCNDWLNVYPSDQIKEECFFLKQEMDTVQH